MLLPAGVAAAAAAAFSAVTVGPSGQVATIAEAILRGSNPPYDLQGEVILQAGTFGPAGNCGLDITQNGGLTIRGAGRDATVIDCAGKDRFAFATSMGPFYLKDVTVRNGRADYGGALQLTSIHSVLESVTLSNNTATEQGGALWLWSGSFVATDVDFDGNDARAEGASVWGKSLYVRVNGGSWSGSAPSSRELHCENGAIEIYVQDELQAVGAERLSSSCNKPCTITVRNITGHEVENVDGAYQLCPRASGGGALPLRPPIALTAAVMVVSVATAAALRWP
jgi:hypothetical protein